MLRKLPHAIHHLIGQCINFLVVLGLTNLSPSEADDAKCSKKSLLVGNIHPAFHRLAPQVGLCA